MGASDLLWIEEGRRFLPEDIVFWHGRNGVPFAERAAQIDTIVFGPHASAAFPAELEPFVSPDLTRRKQFDFSDALTSQLGRAWAKADPHVVFVENPHSRLVMDANREPTEDIGPGLRTFFERLRSAEKDGKASFAGVDLIRPVTFSGEPVLLEPKDDGTWSALVAALQRSADLGARPYMRVRDALVEKVLAAQRPGKSLLLISLHDTMNTQMMPDGAITRQRAPADRLPALANFGNLGDEHGEGEATSIAGERLRRLKQAWTIAWELRGEKANAISLNAPYKGAFETQYWGRRLRRMKAAGIGIVQVEFLREALLGSDATQQLRRPGNDWPQVDPGHVSRLVDRLVRAGEQLRN